MYIALLFTKGTGAIAFDKNEDKSLLTEGDASLGIVRACIFDTDTNDFDSIDPTFKNQVQLLTRRIIQIRQQNGI